MVVHLGIDCKQTITTTNKHINKQITGNKQNKRLRSRGSRSLAGRKNLDGVLATASARKRRPLRRAKGHLRPSFFMKKTCFFHEKTCQKKEDMRVITKLVCDLHLGLSAFFTSEVGSKHKHPRSFVRPWVTPSYCEQCTDRLQKWVS